jgi:hypothetical protein
MEAKEGSLAIARELVLQPPSRLWHWGEGGVDLLVGRVELSAYRSICASRGQVGAADARDRGRAEEIVPGVSLMQIAGENMKFALSFGARRAR